MMGFDEVDEGENGELGSGGAGKGVNSSWSLQRVDVD
jgi:hypothetical protein